GVRLLAGDELRVVAPYGLDDLLACVCRHNPARVSPEFYAQRVAAKGWARRWPRLTYLPPG
ncbi:MAG TPA: nucleotidyltransferase family protein, partial [Candidatus Limnocylindria bacterium]